jgi:hypothetical protein
MKLDKTKQISDLAVYAVLAAVVFGISIWILLVDKDAPHNWFLYFAMAVTAIAGLIRFALPSRRTN